MLPPVTVVELQHDLARRIVVIEEDISEQLIAGVESQFLRCAIKVMLMKTVVRYVKLRKVPRLVRYRSRERSGISLNPIPIDISFSVARRPSRKCLIEPNKLARSGSA